MALSALDIAPKSYGHRIGLVYLTTLLLWPLCTFGEERIQGWVKYSTIQEISTQTIHPAWVLVNPKQTVSGSRPKCATNTNVFVIDPTTTGGRAALASILSAAAEGNLVDLYGTGKCNQKLKADAEELEAVVVKFK